METANRVHLNIGTNLGDRRHNLQLAVDALRELSARYAPADRGSEFRVSAPVESEPWGYDSPNRYLNLGVSFNTTLTPTALLALTQVLEARLSGALSGSSSEAGLSGSCSASDSEARLSGTAEGQRRGEATLHRNADGSYRDRLVDIDIILFGTVRTDSPTLTIPHPHYLAREFVLTPLREIDPALLAANTPAPAP